VSRPPGPLRRKLPNSPFLADVGVIPVLRAAVEGDGDEAVVRALVEGAGLTLGDVYVKRGKGELDKKLPAYRQASRFAPWLVVRDLDHDASCAPELVRTLTGSRDSPPAGRFLLRIAVREIESWLLADREALAGYLKVSPDILPASPDELAEPKTALVALARRSRLASIRRDMVPAQGSSARVGPVYNGHLIRFATDFWDPVRGSRRSPSLRRALTALRELKAELHAG